ncbi:hypothetical protein V6N11_079280 [Hibiscus sabdariffa]|uniref:F-box associated domain-containing protein n=1 Tax=Hibiscus sabdariffa TaxID=183260 RepID=A0ABR2RV22_9ROSI
MVNLPLLSAQPEAAELHELWVMKEYGVVDSWTKVLILPRDDEYLSVSRVLGFRKNGEVLLEVDNEKMASLDLNCQQMKLHEVEVGGDL